ncbi:YciI family protein [Roseateles sp. LYH14W]|uniref:YciI family protein n=1 Tax=Pelomonas parva TaxID=3299032 RepID=A0ABW7FAU3_9BURK
MDKPKHDYLVISRGQWDERASTEDVQRAIDQFYVWYEGHLASGRMKPGSRLTREGKLITQGLVTDGPYTETKELVGGYWFIVATSLDEAAELALQNPCLAFGLMLEVRPLEPERARAEDITNETPPAWRDR